MTLALNSMFYTYLSITYSVSNCAIGSISAAIFFFQAEDGIRYSSVTGVQTCAFFFSSRRRHTRFKCDWSSDVCSSDLTMRTIGAGPWGGPHVNLTVTPEGFKLEFDCATGSAKGHPVIDRKGRFKLYGTYVSQAGSPSVPREAHPAEYSGSVKGELMALDVKLTDSKQSIGIYKLGFGRLQRLNKCPATRPPDPSRP